MGYRSQVHVMTDHKGFEKMCEIAWDTAKENNISDENVLFPKPNSNDQDVFDIYDSDGNYVHLGFDWVKWYEDYTHISLFMETLYKANDEGVAWMFMRIGEDYTDIETSCSDNFYDSGLPVMYTSVEVAY